MFTFAIGMPQLIMLIIFGYTMINNTVKHGEPRSRYNFWSCLVEVALGLGLLYWGGFF